MNRRICHLQCRSHNYASVACTKGAYDECEIEQSEQSEQFSVKALDHIASAFLRRILRRMKELGVNQSELAKRMKVSKPYITKVLRQDVNFSFRTAAKLARALEMDFIPGLQERKH